MEIFGFEITRKKDELRVKETQTAKSFVPPVDDDGTPVIQQQAGYISGGAYGAYVDMEGGIKNEAELIRRYREISLVPECDSAIEDIVSEGIVSDEKDQSVSIVLDRLPYPKRIKDRVREEFDSVLRLLDFDVKGHDIFRRWYVDGRLYYHKVIDKNNP